MQIDTSWLTLWFDRFNHDYFASRLPRPHLSVGRSRTRLGSMSFRRRFRLLKVCRTDFSIRLSNYYDMSERQFQNVLLHEMIHYSIAYDGLHDTSPHGHLFRARMEAFNKEYGWEITVTTSVRGLHAADAQRPKHPYLVLALTMKTGEQMLTVVHPCYALQIEHILLTVSSVECHGWYTSCDDYFFAFPRVRSLRGRRVPVVLYDQKISEMTPFSVASGTLPPVRLLRP